MSARATKNTSVSEARRARTPYPATERSTTTSISTSTTALAASQCYSVRQPADYVARVMRPKPLARRTTERQPAHSDALVLYHHNAAALKVLGNWGEIRKQARHQRGRTFVAAAQEDHGRF